MEIRQIEYFLALFEEGSVTRAARRLNVVQPAVSMQIAKLEDELGQLLFHRVPKGMVPTDAGSQAYALLSPVLRDLGEARQRLTSLDGQIGGSVSLGVIASVSNNVLSECVASFHEKYPRVTVRATGGFTRELQEMVVRGELDLALINQSDRRTRLPSVEIMREDLLLIGAADTPPPVPPPVPLSALAAVDMVVPSRRHGLRTIIDDAVDAAGAQLRPRMEFDEIAPIEDFVMRTRFLTLLPRIAVHRALDAGRLSCHPVTPAISRRIVCVHSPGRPLSPAAELLIQEFRDRLGTPAPAAAIDPAPPEDRSA